MKKNLLTIAVMLLSAVAFAQIPDDTTNFQTVCSTGQTLWYKITSPNTVALKECVNWGSNSANLDIPAEVEHNGVTYRVNVIRSGAISSDVLHSVSIPWSIDTMQTMAFTCSSLFNVHFNARDCYLAYENSTNAWGHTVIVNIMNLYIGDSVIRIGDSAFLTAKNLRYLEIGQSVTHIGRFAFKDALLDTLVSHAAQAPSLGDIPNDTVFSPHHFMTDNTKVLVPCGSLESYRQGWTMFKTIYENADYYDVTVNNDGFGEAYVLEKFCEDQKAVIKAEPYYGYMFSGWDDGNTDNPRTLYLTQDTVMTAHFAPLSVDEGCETPLSAYPNPTDGTFTIEAEDITAVEVFDQLGQKVMTDHSGSRTVNVSALPAGIYFLKVETATGTKYGKLMRR